MSSFCYFCSVFRSLKAFPVLVQLALLAGVQIHEWQRVVCSCRGAKSVIYVGAAGMTLCFRLLLVGLPFDEQSARPIFSSSFIFFF